jgi:Bacterial Ig-like domain
MKQALNFLIIALLLVGCAQTGPPTGGPEDKTPPEVVDVFPLHGSTNVDTSTTLILRFAEPVNRNTLRAAFGLSPPPPGVVRADWSGKKVEISFDPALLPDRTYALTIGTQLSDERNNKLSDTYVLAFSTGDILDIGRLSGSLMVEDEPIGWDVTGYFLDDSTDVPDPSIDPPDATTQTGADGSWTLTNLREGRWRVFAFKDLDADRLWTPWMDRLAVPAYDVSAFADSVVRHRELILRPSDPILLPQPLRVSAMRKDQLLVRMDRKPFKLEAEYSLQPLPEPEEGEVYSEDWVLEDEDLEIPAFNRGYKPGDSTVVIVGLERPVVGDAVGLRVFGTYGTKDTVDTVMAVDLFTAAIEDTLQPSLVSVIPDDRARLHPGMNKVWLTFSEPVRVSDPNGIKLYGGLEDTLIPEVQLPYPNRMTFSIDPETPGGGLTLDLFGESVVDLAGNTLRDSLLTYKYAWLPEDSLGFLSGFVTAPDPEAPIHLSFQDVHNLHQRMTLTVPGSGEFTMNDLPAGLWKIQGWQDVSRTVRWFAGTAVPFVPSDPVFVSRDTIDVRARWETGGLEIIFP